jgi:ankyrin repeat protein
MKVYEIALLLGASSLAGAAADQRLADAAKLGDREIVRSLLRQHADVNAPQGDGATAISWAVHRSDLETTDLLIRAGANVNAANAYGITPLYLACLNGNPAMVEKLLKAGANPNATLPSGETVLMRASRTGNVEAVKLLLARSADPNAKENKRGQTALMWALAENHPEVVRELIAHGADVQARTKSGFTVLMFAAQQGNVDAARMLVAAGAKVNDSTPEDGTALVVASASGHEDFAKFLLSKDANPNATDRYGVAPLHFAILRGLSLGAGVEWYPSAPYLYRSNMPGLVKALLANGANPNARMTKAPPLPGIRRLAVMSVNGATPYILAALSYDADLMRVLVAAGADPHLTTEEHTTALIYAAGLAEGLGKTPVRTEEDDKKAFEAVKLAVELGDDVNGANKDGVTALHGAAFVGSNAIVQFLVDKGAKVNVTDTSGQTPWTVAAQVFPPTLLDDNLRPQSGHPSTADLLLKLGATPYVPVASK